MKASPGIRFFIYVTALLVCALVGMVLTLFLARGNDIFLLKVGQGVSSLMMFVVPPIILYVFTRTQPIQALGFRKPVSGWLLLVGVVLMFVSLPLTNQLGTWNEKMNFGAAFERLESLLRQAEDMAGDLTERMLQVDTVWGLLFNLLVIALIPALGEELTFRGMLQQALVKGCKNAHVGIFLSAAIFSFIHFQFYGFLPRMFLGLLLGYMFYYSGSLWTSILMHFVNNGAAVVVAYFEQRNQISTSVEDFGATDSPIILVASLMATVLLIVLCSKIKYKYGRQ
ncbi:MAG: CPBP family intramembrane metalloprotease [Bacteroidales bacterium]|nr:CPBP family intramembrane metalloprotease [Bacteroidales bacterium]